MGWYPLKGPNMYRLSIDNLVPKCTLTNMFILGVKMYFLKGSHPTIDFVDFESVILHVLVYLPLRIHEINYMCNVW